jgi:hypothetical protein
MLECSSTIVSIEVDFLGHDIQRVATEAFQLRSSHAGNENISPEQTVWLRKLYELVN